MQNYKRNVYLNRNVRSNSRNQYTVMIDSVCVCVCVCVCFVILILVPFKHVTNTHLLTGVPALFSNICHLKGRNPTYFNV
jgi:hypothetical protein